MLDEIKKERYNSFDEKGEKNKSISGNKEKSGDGEGKSLPVGSYPSLPPSPFVLVKERGKWR